MARSLSDRAALDAIAARLNRKRHPDDIAAALLLILVVEDRVRETGRRVPRYRKQPFKRVPKAESQLRAAVQRCVTHGYELDKVSRIVLDLFTIPLAPGTPSSLGARQDLRAVRTTKGATQ